MGTVVIDRRGTHLSYANGALSVRVPEETPRYIPLRLIEQLVIAGAVSIESPLLTHLAENDVAVLVMPGRGARRSSLLYAPSHGNSARRIAQYRGVGDADNVLAWARRFVQARANGAGRLLRRALALRPDLRYELLRGIEALDAVRRTTQDATTLAGLRGMEGAAAAIYFATFQALFAPSLAFHGRNRRPPRDPVNAVLSLGYTLLHVDAVRAIVQAGLDPMLGFLHEPAYSRESLACDFVEIARPHVEQVTWRLFADQRLSADQFSDDNGACRMHKAARGTCFAAFEGSAASHRRAFRRLARVVVHSLGEAAADSEEYAAS
ncbi:MAG TPA: CRISPR-associated endonuclease Cas1 [Nevskiaceae bacterium]